MFIELTTSGGVCVWQIDPSNIAGMCRTGQQTAISFKSGNSRLPTHVDQHPDEIKEMIRQVSK